MVSSAVASTASPSALLVAVVGAIVAVTATAVFLSAGWFYRRWIASQDAQSAKIDSVKVTLDKLHRELPAIKKRHKKLGDELGHLTLFVTDLADVVEENRALAHRNHRDIESIPRGPRPGPYRSTRRPT